MKVDRLAAIFWDFDGVLMDTNVIRDQGFQEVLQEFPKEEVDQLLEYHQANGGLSRYVKFRYFFEEIRKESITEREVQQWADQFSAIMKNLLINPELLIPQTIKFIQENYRQIPMHIVSGSDEMELRYVCKQMGIAGYFQSIHGSPVPKKTLIANILKEEGYPKQQCLLIGDAVNDFEAAGSNGIYFKGYNNPQVEALTNMNFTLS